MPDPVPIQNPSPQTPTVPFLDPSGTPRMIPVDQVPAAMQAGGKQAVKILAPDGTPHWIPVDQQDAAIQAGGQIADDTEDAVGRLPGESYGQGIERRATSLVEGVHRGLDSGFLPLDKLVHRIPGVGEFLSPQSSIDAEQKVVTAPVERGHAEGIGLGQDLESIFEFMGGDAVLTKTGRALTIAEKLQQAGELGKMIQKYPGLARILGTAGRQAVVAGTQAAAHGGDADDVARAALLTGAVGAGFEAVPVAAQSLTSRIAPTTRNIAGVEIPVLASQEPGASGIAANAASISSEPAFQEAQQSGSQQAIGNIAQQATRNALETLNEGRVDTRPPAITDPARQLPGAPFTFKIEGPNPVEDVQLGSSEGRGVNYAGQQSVPNPAFRPEALPEQQGEIGTSADAVPPRAITGEPTTTASQWQYVPPESGAGGVNRTGSGTLQTTNPALAHAALSQLEEIAEAPSFDKLSPRAQGKINESIASLQQQLSDYGQHAAESPHFQPVDAQGAAAQVNNFRDAAVQIERAAQPVYRQLDTLSDGTWSSLRKSEQAALKIIRNPSSTDAYESAITRLGDVRSQMHDIFEANREQISPEEWRSANTAWRMASTARDIHATLESTMNGVSAEVSTATGIPRTMKGGTPAFKRLGALLDKRGSEVHNLIGDDGVHNLYRIADLLKRPEQAQGLAKLMQGVSMVLRRHGAGLGAVVGGVMAHGAGAVLGHAFPAYQGMVAGALGEAALRRTLNAVATNPKIAQRVAYAVQHNVAPHIAAPLVASMIIGNIKDQQAQGKK